MIYFSLLLIMSNIFRQSADWMKRWIPSSTQRKVVEVERVVVQDFRSMLPASSQVFIRIAGVSGAVAVILGAYGAHGELGSCFRLF